MYVNKRVWLDSIASDVAVTIAGVPAAAQQPKKPNIVVILMDNLGYGELGVYGGGILGGAATPRIDTLAGEGMRLLNFNVEAQGTPSRSALLTGPFAIRSGTYEVPIGGVPMESRSGKSQLRRRCRSRATQLDFVWLHPSRGAS
jgi:Sulfatase